jgi:hypothetical protein
MKKKMHAKGWGRKVTKRPKWLNFGLKIKIYVACS